MQAVSSHTKGPHCSMSQISSRIRNAKYASRRPLQFRECGSPKKNCLRFNFEKNLSRPDRIVQQYLVSIRDESVALEVGSHDNEKDAEHGMPAVPALSVGGHTKAAAGELGVSLSELLDSLGHGVGHAQGADACKSHSTHQHVNLTAYLPALLCDHDYCSLLCFILCLQFFLL
jgi:hypothetical protein